MEIHLSSAQEVHLAALAAASGRSMDDAVQEALAAWAERATDRVALHTSFDAAQASIARGEGVAITPESMQALAEDVCRRGRERLDQR